MAVDWYQRALGNYEVADRSKDKDSSKLMLN